MGKFIINRRVNYEYQFNLKAENGENLLTGEGFVKKIACQMAIEAVRVNSQTDAKYERRISKNDKEYFILKSRFGKILGKSRMYTTESEMEKAIDYMKINALKAEIIDETIDYKYDGFKT